METYTRCRADSHRGKHDRINLRENMSVDTDREDKTERLVLKKYATSKGLPKNVR